MSGRNSGHVILGVQNFSLETFKRQIMLNEQNMWAVVEYFVKLLSKEENGHYILMKDPLKGFIRVYRVPENEVAAMETQSPDKERGGVGVLRVLGLFGLLVLRRRVEGEKVRMTVGIWSVCGKQETKRTC